MTEVGSCLTTPIPVSDLVLCDPPYGLRKDYNGAVEETPYEEWVEALLARTSAPWRLFFGPPVDQIDYARLKPDRVIVWTKTMAQIRKSLVGWQYGITPILVYREPGAKWYGGSTLPGAWDYIAAPSALSEVGRIKRYFPDGRHPAITGTFVARKLIRQLTQPGDLVVDPMAGIGSINAAALMEGRTTWGCEIDPDYAAAANRWCDALRAALEEIANTPWLSVRDARGAARDALATAKEVGKTDAGERLLGLFASTSGPAEPPVTRVQALIAAIEAEAYAMGHNDGKVPWPSRDAARAEARSAVLRELREEVAGLAAADGLHPQDAEDDLLDRSAILAAIDRRLGDG